MKRKVLRGFKHLFLLLCSLGSVFPFYWMFVSSTNSGVDVMRGKLIFGDRLLDNLRALCETTYITHAFLNSLRNSVVLTLASLVVCSLAGYGFVIFRDKGKDRLMQLLLLSMMVPAATTIIPLFRVFSGLHLLDTMAGFILPSVSTAFLIYFFRQNTLSFPTEIVQAARVDGLGELRIFLSIYFPVMRPAYAAATTITFMNAWNAYLWPLIVLQSQESQTMPIMISSMTSRPAVDYGQLMLAVTICTLPTLILFSVLQKSFVAGITGAVKN